MRGAREAPAPRVSLNFRRASLLSSNEFESGTFTIVLHATSSFTYVSVIYGASFPFNTFYNFRFFLSLPPAHNLQKRPQNALKAMKFPNSETAAVGLRLRLRLIYLGRIAEKVKYITYLGCAPARREGSRTENWKIYEE